MFLCKIGLLRKDAGYTMRRKGSLAQFRETLNAKIYSRFGRKHEIILFLKIKNTTFSRQCFRLNFWSGLCEISSIESNVAWWMGLGLCTMANEIRIFLSDRFNKSGSVTIFLAIFILWIQPTWAHDKQAKLVFLKNSFSRRY